MRTALLLTDSTDTQRLFVDLLGGQTKWMPVAPPTEPSREKFDKLFAVWLRLADAVVVDAVALGQMTRWPVESLIATVDNGQVPVIIRLSAAQRTQYTLPVQWLVVSDTDAPEQLRQSLTTFLELHETKARLSRHDEDRRPAAEPVRVPATPLDSYRYRDAIKSLSRLIGQRHAESELLAEFLRLVGELVGVGKLAIFTRQIRGGLFTGESMEPGDQLTVACSYGVPQTIVEHFRLTLDSGIGGRLAREVRILRRSQPTGDARIEREFELLGSEVAVPMIDDDQLLGVLTFSGKITGEPLSNDELELVYQLSSQISQALHTLRLAERVAAHQRLMSEVLANVQSGVLVVDQDEQILAVNDRLRALLELGVEPLIGRELGRIHGRVSDVVFAALHGENANVEQEVILPRSSRPLRVRVTRFELADTSLAVVVALVEDLTQEKIELAHRQEMDDREFFTRLSFRLSHELRNALSAIKIFAQLLPERYTEKEFREQFSSVVANEVNRVDVLVNNLTFFSHPLALVYDEVVLTELLESCLKNVSGEFARKQLAQVVGVGEKAPDATAAVPVVTMKKNFAHKLARLEGDKLRLMQAFEHVLRNALQALPSGGRLNLNTGDALPTDLADGQLPAGGAVKIEFQDTGEGIALENLPRVTDPFVTTRNVGVGLGLTIVKKIVERHGGRLEIDSLLGRGTTLTMVLPVKAQPHPEDALLQQLAQQAGLEEDHGEGDAPSRLPKSLGKEHGERS